MAVAGVGCRVIDEWFSGGEWRSATSETQPLDRGIHEFVVPGEPRSKARPRVTRLGHTYTPKTTQDAETAVREAYTASGGDIMTGTLGIDVLFCNGTRIRKDIDNQLKLVLDALNGVAYADDHQVMQARVRRRFVDKADACTRVRLFKL